MSWCLIFVLFAPYVRFHAPNFEEDEGSYWFGSVHRVSPVPRGGTQKFSVYIGEADFFGVKILNFRIFWGFQKN